MNCTAVSGTIMLHLALNKVPQSLKFPLDIHPKLTAINRVFEISFSGPLPSVSVTVITVLLVV